MAQGQWEDFREKSGFSDGVGVTEVDIRARKRVIELINQHPAVQSAKITAVEFDRGGCHNSCLILILPNPDGKTADQLLNGDMEEVFLPDDVDTNEIVAEAYNDEDPMNWIRRDLDIFQDLANGCDGADILIRERIAEIKQYIGIGV